MKYDFVSSERSALLSLQRATHATLHRIATELVDLDMTASEINALGNLADGQSRTVSQVAALIGARPTTMTSVLDRLDKRGLITRVARAGDRRSVLIELTDSGRATAAAIRRTFADLESRTLGDLPPEAVVGFYTVLDALIEKNR
ncbi:MarR family winged helix-turn-helix transcriptional regulator [Nocardia sp. CA-135398]|uniref:MarR family winged helix-turn-helix transcriptional regulator n=1 Tax=Nocardia sp. CA-135398 TaxID=3239977 RepID=UPI003D978772